MQDLWRNLTLFQHSYYLCQNMLEDLHPKCVFCPETANAHPYLCLCLESFCCAGGAVGGSRHYISKKYDLTDTPLEGCFGKILSVSIFCGLIGATYAVCFSACMGTQQVRELKEKGQKTKQPITPFVTKKWVGEICVKNCIDGINPKTVSKLVKAKSNNFASAFQPHLILSWRKNSDHLGLLTHVSEILELCLR